ncbi:protein FAM162A [Paroedura picta]|uniref:protein FAM162A n=1 Tax=Paroedura picta TaxID=143630 RepID=UPI004055A3C4
MAGAAGGGNIVRLLDRNAFCVVRMTKATRWQASRRLCTKPPEGGAPKPSGPGFRIPGYKPTDWDKKTLLWTGRFKKAEDIPEILPPEVISSARNKIRVQISYLMMISVVLGCLGIVIFGKRAAARHESLTSLNLERKAHLRKEAESSPAKP